MHCRVRLVQFKYWFGGDNLLSILGKMRQVERSSPGSLSWTSLEALTHVVQDLPPNSPPEEEKEDEEMLEVQSEAFSEVQSKALSELCEPCLAAAKVTKFSAAVWAIGVSL